MLGILDQLERKYRITLYIGNPYADIGLDRESGLTTGHMCLRQIFKTHCFTRIVKVNGTDCSAPMFSNEDLCIILVVPFAGTIAPPALFAIYHFSVDEQYDVRIIFKLTSAPHVSPFGSFSFTFFPLSKSMQLGENDYRNTEFLCEGFQRT